MRPKQRKKNGKFECGIKGCHNLASLWKYIWLEVGKAPDTERLPVMVGICKYHPIDAVQYDEVFNLVA